MPDLFFIEIDAEGVLSFDKSEGAVATGNSGGVDSFYTIVKHMNESGSYKLTHLLFNNI